jgi:DNA modification methylase
MVRGTHHILTGDVREQLRAIAPGTVQAAITSPPYWSLRDYSVAGQIGLEPTIDEYVAVLVGVMRAVRDCLHPTGTLWLNLGDTYAATGKSGGASGAKNLSSAHGTQPRTPRHAGLKTGDLCNVPHRVAAALQADGWYWRSTIVWQKRSPMAESLSGWRWRKCRVKVRGQNLKCDSINHTLAGGMANGRPHTITPDWQATWAPCPGCPRCEPHGGYVLRRGSWRPTTAHEYVFLFSKSPTYYCDGDAVQEPAVGGAPGNKRSAYRDAYLAGDKRMRTKLNLGFTDARETRNPRSVWAISAESFRGAHFACYPSDLVRRCLLAATPAAGCCPACRTPHAPVVESERVATRPGVDTKVNGHAGTVCGNRDPQRHIAVTRVTGYRPACACPPRNPVPCLVLDPFMGSGTTLQTAVWYGRDAVGVELNPAYVALAESRIATMPRCLARELRPRSKVRGRVRGGAGLFDQLGGVT